MNHVLMFVSLCCLIPCCQFHGLHGPSFARSTTDPETSCHQMSISQQELYLECGDYRTMPFYDITINCTTGLLKWRLRGREHESTPNRWPSWVDGLTRLTVYQTCTNLSTNTTSVDMDIYKKIYQQFSKSGGSYTVMSSSSSDGASCTFGICNGFPRFECLVLNEETVTCPSPATTGMATNSYVSSSFHNATASSCTLQSCTVTSTASSSVVLMSSHWPSQASNSVLVVTVTSTSISTSSSLTTSHPSEVNLMSSELKESSMGETFTTTLSLTPSANEISHGNDTDSYSLLLVWIIMAAVTITVFATFIAVSSICVVVYQRYSSVNKTGKTSHSGDTSSMEMNTFQLEVTNVIYSKELSLAKARDNHLAYKLSNGDKPSSDNISNGSLLTVYEDVVFKSTPHPSSSFKYETNTVGNPYVFTTSTSLLSESSNSSSKRIQQQTFTDSNGHSPEDESNEDGSYISSSFTSISSGIPGSNRSSYMMSNSGKPTDIDDMRKKFQPDLY